MTEYDGMCAVRTHYVDGTGVVDHLEVIQADDYINISGELLESLDAPGLSVDGDLVTIADTVTYRIVGPSVKYPGAFNAEKVA